MEDLLNGNSNLDFKHIQDALQECVLEMDRLQKEMQYYRGLKERAPNLTFSQQASSIFQNIKKHLEREAKISPRLVDGPTGILKPYSLVVQKQTKEGKIMTNIYALVETGPQEFDRYNIPQVLLYYIDHEDMRVVTKAFMQICSKNKVPCSLINLNS